MASRGELPVASRHGAVSNTTLNAANNGRHNTLNSSRSYLLTNKQSQWGHSNEKRWETHTLQSHTRQWTVRDDVHGRAGPPTHASAQCRQSQQAVHWATALQPIELIDVNDVHRYNERDEDVPRRQVCRRALQCPTSTLLAHATPDTNTTHTLIQQ